ncbi:MAG: molybdenum cofactor biosynthesis protein MoaE [Coriobacteriia bacterium]|nr:molybdenum cofactor biosynthesis protein MoaE [Coriobacteriia bacterium]
MALQSPSMDEWLKEAKADPSAKEVGMYLVHNGTVREDPKKLVREGIDDGKKVNGMFFDYDEAGLKKAIDEAYHYPGVKYLRVWLNRGELKLGDDIMYVLVGGDIRPNVIDALQKLVEVIKTQLVVENEQYK